MVTINGKRFDYAGKRLSEYLQAAGYDCKKIAVECNGEIVSKSHYSETILQDEDVLEVVSFVGGG